MIRLRASSPLPNATIQRSKGITPLQMLRRAVLALLVLEAHRVRGRTRPALSPTPTPVHLVRVTVSENQSDTLAVSLQCSRGFVNHTIVITSPMDRETQRVCSQSRLTRCHVTEALHLNGDPFNKGRALQEVSGRDARNCHQGPQSQ